MNRWNEWLSDDHLALLERGGWILLLILLVSLLLWVLIIERYWYLQFTHKRRLRNLERMDSLNRIGMRVHILAGLNHYLASIAALVQVLPLLGLLGTVVGMIEVFDVITVFGTGNSRGMAGGISAALITTMAGLLTAISGLWFSGDLKRRIAREMQHLTQQEY